MTESEECPHGLGDPAWCSLCLKRPEPPDETFGKSFEAEYRGDCADCGEGISVGDLIAVRYVNGARAGVVHEECQS